MQRYLVPLLAVAGLLLGVFAARTWFAAPEAPAVNPQTVIFPVARTVPSVALQSTGGGTLDLSQPSGRWTLVFFGFTQCPDVCPTTLATLAAARRQIADTAPDADPRVADPRVADPRVVFVSVDPGRDPVGVVRDYVAFFDPAFVGATAPAPAIDTLTRGLGVAVRLGTPDADGRYAVDHTSALFLLDPQGRYVALLGTPHTRDGIAQDYLAIARAAARAS